MIKKTILLVLLVKAGFICAQTPINLDNSNMPSKGDTLRYTNIQLSSIQNYATTGVNHTWNFASVISGTSGLRSYVGASQTPHAFYFILNSSVYGEKLDNFGANTGTFAINDFYNFYKKSTSPNCFQAEAVGLTLNSIPVASFYSDKDEIYNFPMTYPKYDSTTFRFSTPSTSLLPITYTRRGYRVTKVDGWGTIVTPFGTENCLRLVTTQYSQDTMAVSLSTLIPIPIKFGFANNQRSYQWLTTTSKIPYLEVSGSLIGNNFTVTQARYRGYDKNKVNTALSNYDSETMPDFYPNPVKDVLKLNRVLTANETIQILDIEGRLVKTIKPGAEGEQTFVNTTELAKGLYMLKINSEQSVQIIRFIKE